MKELRPQEIAAALEADARLIVPVGTCEQHGPHLPVGCDTLIVEYLADDLSAEFGVLRAPTVEYGVNAAEDAPSAGNAAVRKKTLHRTLNDLLGAWESAGVREFILLTAHEHDPHQEAMATVTTVEARVRVVDILGMNFADLLDAQATPMHGDEVDTSLLLFLYPDLVRMDLAQDYMASREELRRFRRGWLRVPADSPGSIGRPSAASAAKGEAIYHRIRTKISDRIFLAAPPP
ncbi:MAG: creatininase family protein [Gemmatimonadaceae bacterium]